MTEVRNLEVLFLPRYERLGSSSRVRCYQYLPGLKKFGINCHIVPLLSDRYIRRLYTGRPIPWFDVIAGFLRRGWECIRNRRVDLVWIERELLPWWPHWLEGALLNLLAAPYVADFDDAIFHRYDLHKRSIVRKVLGGKTDQFMRGAASVVVGNEYLYARAVSAGARHVEILPSVVDTARYGVSRRQSEHQIRIGWIGAPVTASFLDLVRQPLAQICAKYNARVVVIGAELRGWNEVTTQTISWSEEIEQDLAEIIDIGIMPLTNGPFEQGKCGYKLIQYMAAGLPVVASPVGINKVIVRHGVNGFLADGSTDWSTYLGLLCEDSALRYRLGTKGRTIAESEFSLKMATPRLAEMLWRASARAEQSVPA